MSRTRRMKVGVWVCALIACARLSQAQSTDPTAAAHTRDENLHAYVELLRSDVRAQKVAIITEMMQFTDAEDAAFWPVYRQYETDLAKINDDRIALIKEYAAASETLSDDQADRFARRAIELEGKRHDLMASAYERFRSVLPPKTAARFLQVEHQILLLMDLQIAAALPVVSR